MGQPTREPPPIGGTKTSEDPPARRYVATYGVDGDETTHDRWLLEWMLAWIDDPDVRRIGADRVDGARYRIVVDVGPVIEEYSSPDSHRRLFDRLDERADGLTIRCDSAMDNPCSIVADRRGSAEVNA
ncbi:hypothetical protein GRS48_07055 [Halorubrum sp. JWXQ-INN 858]|uniref:hypothetical protein n=1 Tax=Halorubrum sp. JWXQ-INN 858 TaxID=2690782 RepID=UPI001359AB31|nr:hypothetical protein [Halorubrum sp. JWXQ-INN 858]MWV64583.1 hypothetical protein [Halorubrum sp. JWXQ-INN 858]